MKPAFFIVATSSGLHRFTSRAMARAYAALCRVNGHNAIVKPMM